MSPQRQLFEKRDSQGRMINVEDSVTNQFRLTKESELPTRGYSVKLNSLMAPRAAAQRFDRLSSYEVMLEMSSCYSQRNLPLFRTAEANQSCSGKLESANHNFLCTQYHSSMADFCFHPRRTSRSKIQRMAVCERLS